MIGEYKIIQTKALSPSRKYSSSAYVVLRKEESQCRIMCIYYYLDAFSQVPTANFTLPSTSYRSCLSCLQMAPLLTNSGHLRVSSSPVHTVLDVWPAMAWSRDPISFGLVKLKVLRSCWIREIHGNVGAKYPWQYMAINTTVSISLQL